MSQRPVDSHHPSNPVFCAADAQLRSFFVEVTDTTPNALAAAGWVVCNLERFVPDSCEAELDVTRLRCVGWEPGLGALDVWHFDVSDALTVRPGP